MRSHGAERAVRHALSRVTLKRRRTAEPCVSKWLLVTAHGSAVARALRGQSFGRPSLRISFRLILAWETSSSPARLGGGRSTSFPQNIALRKQHVRLKCNDRGLTCLSYKTSVRPGAGRQFRPGRKCNAQPRFIGPRPELRTLDGPASSKTTGRRSRAVSQRVRSGRRRRHGAPGETRGKASRVSEAARSALRIVSTRSL